MDMSEVKSFNAELSGLYDNKPPISKAKMSAITRGAIKAIKFYKHVVHSVEKFIQKCKPEYKVPGLYVIDSIVRQSRHQFGQDKDVFAPRFAKNMQQTFANLFRCPPEDKRNIIRVLNLWQKNNVFSPQVIQPLLDMADPNHPLHQEIQQQQNNTANGSSLNLSHNASDSKSSPVQQLHTPHDSSPMGDQFQDQPSGQPAKFNRKLLNDFEYESEDDAPPEPSGGHSSHASHSTHTPHAPHTQNTADALGSILTNPEIMRQLQSLQAQMQLMTGMQIPNLMPVMSDLQMQQNQNQSLPFMNSQQDSQKSNDTKDDMVESDIEFVETGPQVIEIPDANDSRLFDESPSPKSRRHRSRSKSPRRRRRSSRSRSRSPRRKRDRDRERDRERDKERDKEKNHKEREAEREKQREREKKGLPPIKKENLSVCSTTLWVGHLSKLATPEELWDLFGALGGVASIDVVAPRGCAFVVMERRRDAARALARLHKHKLHSKEITVAWAPPKGVKGRDWKDYWEADAGVAYLPWPALHKRWALGALSLDALEDGGAVDEDTLPPWLPPRILPKSMLDNMSMLGGAGLLLPGGLPAASLPASLPAALPPTPAPSLTMPVPRMPPPGMAAALPAGLAGLPPTLRPPSLPNAPGLPGLQNETGLPPSGPLLRFPPGIPPQSIPQPGMVGGFLGGLLGVGVGVGGLVGGVPLLHHAPLLPARDTPPPRTQHRNSDVNHSDDAMDLDTEETHGEDEPAADLAAQLAAPPPALLPDQIQQLLKKPPPNFNSSEPPPGFNITEPPPFNVNQPPPDEKQDDERKDRDRERRGERDRDRDRRDRDRRDRGDNRPDNRERRDRDRGRDRDRERDDRRDRDRDRGRDRRDRDRDRDRERGGDRFGSRDNNRERPGSREKSPRAAGAGPAGAGPAGAGEPAEKTLQERLWEMANGKPRDDKRDDLPPAAPAEHGPWLDGPGPGPGPFGPRFNGMGPPFNRPPFDGPRPPFDGPPMFEGGPRFERPPFGRMPFDGMNRPPFDGPRPPFDGPRPPFDGPRPPFDGPRPPFEGPRSFDGPPFDGERPPFDGPPRFDGPPEFYDRPRRFDDREQYGDRGWSNDRERDWGDRPDRGDRTDRPDRRPDWEDRRRDRRPREHDDNRFNNRPQDRPDRRRTSEENQQNRQSRTPREDRNDRNNPRRDRDRKSRWGAAEEAEANGNDDSEKPQEASETARDEASNDTTSAEASEPVETSQDEQSVQMADVEQNESIASEGTEVESERRDEPPIERTESPDPPAREESTEDRSYDAESSKQEYSPPEPEQEPVAETRSEISNDLYDANDAIDTSFSATASPGNNDEEMRAASPVAEREIVEPVAEVQKAVDMFSPEREQSESAPELEAGDALSDADSKEGAA
ncbi:unnamed protein product [Chrysodeixis includens]|uniref:Splicing factor, arginine/serine-rich 15 n=1 Tax=Chrysodeixis includens TaxID=689277 RepID=A0A9P0FUS7_CHRIL|nr:unnamed protein product [Chrysodeixis includens]